MKLKIYTAKPHADVADSYRGLGEICINQGHYQQAREHLEKSLEILFAVFPAKSHPYIASTYHVLGRLYRAQEEYKRASAYFKKALAIRQEYLRQENPDILQTIQAIGGICKKLTDGAKSVATSSRP